MARPRLYYDANCPICNNYVRLIKRKVSPTVLDFLPASSSITEFQFVDSKNLVFSGEQAIEKLVQAFPAIKNYFWMLPDKYKMKAIKTAYKVGNAVRNVTRKIGGCRCGKNRTRN